MNRTIFVAGWLLLVAPSPLFAQTPPSAPAAKAQADLIDELVGAMRAAEAALTRVALTMRTHYRQLEGLEITTLGELRVVRGEQAAIRTRFECTHSDGLRSRVDAVQTADGILLWQDDPVSGEMFARIDGALVADLEWAGRVLRRDDLPGMGPAEGGSSGPGSQRATAPLGSGVLAAARRQFVLTVDKRTEHNGEAGTWLAGPRRAGLDAQDPAVPVADRVELFVRSKDRALLLANYFVGTVAVQSLVVEQIDVAPTFGPDAFLLDAGGRRPQPVDRFKPLFAQIEEALAEAESKSARDAEAKNAKLAADQQVKAEVRPSRR
jgi:hypothetical protein